MNINKIEIHVIQSFPAHCLNRDNNNDPKSVMFGNANRARVSSQCWKRAARIHMKEHGIKTGIRSRQLAGLLVEKAPSSTIIEAHALITYVFAKPKDLDKKTGKGNKNSPAQANVEPILSDEKQNAEKTKNYSTDTSSVLVFISPSEIDEAVKCLEEKIPLDEAAERIKKAGLSADISLFGRMLTDNKTLCVDAATQVAHAFSTHAVIMEDDYFTAIDDLTQTAGMIGNEKTNNRFNASVFYRYAAIDIPLLTRNLGGNKKEALEAVKAFINAFILSVPSAKQTSFAVNTPPNFVMLVSREYGMALSLANAFVSPITTTEDTVVASVNALIEHASNLDRMYSAYDQAQISFISDREANFEPYADKKKNNLAIAIETVLGNEQ